MFPSKPTASSKIPNDVTGGRLYTLKIFELNGKLYIKDNVIVKDNKDTEVQSYAGSLAYEVFADGQSVPSSIADYVQEQNMFVDKPTETSTPKTENNKDTTPPVDLLHSNVESNISTQIDIKNNIVPNPNITDSHQLDRINDENKPVNRSSNISRTGPISRVSDIPKNENTQDGGMNQYVYNRVHRAYPKNVSFSKRNPQKKHNKKTIRKLQNIINNA